MLSQKELELLDRFEQRLERRLKRIRRRERINMWWVAARTWIHRLLAGRNRSLRIRL